MEMVKAARMFNDPSDMEYTELTIVADVGDDAGILTSL